MSGFITAVQTVSISVSLVASGGIAALSLFDIPELQSQPASRSLPSIRWLFSRGSHIFPQAALISSAGFAYLAFAALPVGNRPLLQLLRLGSNSRKVNGYLAASVLTFSIAPFTTFAMLPTNFELIRLNEDKGGARSQESARGRDERASQYRSSDHNKPASVNGTGEAGEFTDLSGPQTQTTSHTTSADDEKVRGLLGWFAVLNAVRAVLIGGGAILGLATALAG